MKKRWIPCGDLTFEGFGAGSTVMGGGGFVEILEGNVNRGYRDWKGLHHRGALSA